MEGPACLFFGEKGERVVRGVSGTGGVRDGWMFWIMGNMMKLWFVRIIRVCMKGWDDVPGHWRLLL